MVSPDSAATPKRRQSWKNSLPAPISLPSLPVPCGPGPRAFSLPSTDEWRRSSTLDPSPQGGKAHGHADEPHDGDRQQCFSKGSPLPATSHLERAQPAEQVGDRIESGDRVQPTGQLAARHIRGREEQKGKEEEKRGVHRSRIAGFERDGIGEAGERQAPKRCEEDESDHPDGPGMEPHTENRTEDQDRYRQDGGHGNVGRHMAHENGGSANRSEEQPVKVLALDVKDEGG